MKTLKEALYDYYVSLMDTAKLKNESLEITEKRNAILLKIIEEMTEDEVANEVNDNQDCVDYITDNGLVIENWKPAKKNKEEHLRRVLIYAASLNNLSNEQLKKAQSLDAIVEAYSDYDIDNEEIIEVNGNKFNYNKDINIADYMEQLRSIGDKSKGQSYSVYLDDEGELVIY